MPLDDYKKRWRNLLNEEDFSIFLSELVELLIKNYEK